MNDIGLAEAALGEGAGLKLHKLSVRELKNVRLSLSMPSFAYAKLVIWYVTF
jgi:hypothetical protein